MKNRCGPWVVVFPSFASPGRAGESLRACLPRPDAACRRQDAGGVVPRRVGWAVGRIVFSRMRSPRRGPEEAAPPLPKASRANRNGFPGPATYRHGPAHHSHVRGAARASISSFSPLVQLIMVLPQGAKKMPLRDGVAREGHGGGGGGTKSGAGDQRKAAQTGWASKSTVHASMMAICLPTIDCRRAELFSTVGGARDGPNPMLPRVILSHRRKTLLSTGEGLRPFGTHAPASTRSTSAASCRAKCCKPLRTNPDLRVKPGKKLSSTDKKRDRFV